MNKQLIATIVAITILAEAQISSPFLNDIAKEHGLDGLNDYHVELLTNVGKSFFGGITAEAAGNTGLGSIGNLLGGLGGGGQQQSGGQNQPETTTITQQKDPNCIPSQRYCETETITKTKLPYCTPEENDNQPCPPGTDKVAYDKAQEANSPMGLIKSVVLPKVNEFSKTKEDEGKLSPIKYGREIYNNGKGQGVFGFMKSFTNTATRGAPSVTNNKSYTQSDVDKFNGKKPVTSLLSQALSTPSKTTKATSKTQSTIKKPTSSIVYRTQPRSTTRRNSISKPTTDVTKDPSKLAPKGISDALKSIG